MIEKPEEQVLRLIKFVPFFIVFMFYVLILIIVFHNRIQINEKKIADIKKKYLQIKKNRIKNEVLALARSINYERKLAEENLKEELKEKVDTAYSIATNIYLQNMDKDEKTIEKMIKDALRPIRFYNQRGYFFIYDMNLKNILLPIAPELEGKDFSNYKDIKGDLVVKNTARLCQKYGDTYYSWYWVKPNDKSKNYKKIGYSKYFTLLDWFIGTGEYITDFEKNIQNKIIRKIEQIRYANNNYFFIIDFQGTVLTHKNRNIIGKNYLNYKDENGNYFVKNMIDIAKNGGGFVKYKTKLFPNQKQSHEKISYVTSIEKWNWVIGSGEYLNDIQKEISIQQDKLKNELKETFIKLSVLFLIVALILILFLKILAEKSKEIFLNYKNSLLEEMEKNRKQLILMQNQNKLAAMGEMLGNIAHQWKQPLNTMGISISKLILLEESDSLNKEIMLKSFKRIEKSIEHLSCTIDVFRDFFRPSKNIEIFDIEKELQEIVYIIQSSFEHNDIKLIYECQKNLFIKGDKNKLEQAIINILNNAKDAIIIESIKNAIVKISTKKENNNAFIIISNSGKNIPESIAEKIFEPYFTTKESTKGTGVGLYMSKIIVENHFGGKLYFKNIKDGVKFIISIPLVKI